jgi:hypothetical protein
MEWRLHRSTFGLMGLFLTLADDYGDEGPYAETRKKIRAVRKAARAAELAREKANSPEDTA